MERNSEDDAALDEEGEDKESGGNTKPSRPEDGNVGVTHACNPKRTASKAPGISTQMLAREIQGTLEIQDEDKSEKATGPRISHDVTEGQAEAAEPERDTPSISPSSFVDTCDPSISSLSSSSYSSSFHNIHFSSSSSSSCPSVLSLTPPLPLSAELSAVLTDTRLTLDVYQGGAAALPLLWGSIPGQLIGVQYLRLGSEDKPGLDGALDVLPHLTQLRSLAIRGTFPCNCMWLLKSNCIFCP